MLALVMRCIRSSCRNAAAPRLCTRLVPQVHTATTPSPYKHVQVLSRTLACAASVASDTKQDSAFPGGLEELLPSHCCGCGIKLQRHDETFPGYVLLACIRYACSLCPRMERSIPTDFSTQSQSTGCPRTSCYSNLLVTQSCLVCFSSRGPAIVGAHQLLQPLRLGMLCIMQFFSTVPDWSQVYADST